MGSSKTGAKPIPKQKKGARSDTAHSVKFRNTDQSSDFYKIAKKRLLNVSNWHALCGLVTATFTLTDKTGKKLRRLAREGDLLRIKIPGPGTSTGKGYDWVRLETIEQRQVEENDLEETFIRVRPAQNPKDDTGQTAHFFQDAASSTFMVIREGNTVRAEVHGRNELPNVDQETKMDSIRNAVVALGAMIGLSKFQWKKLVKGLVAKE